MGFGQDQEHQSREKTARAYTVIKKIAFRKMGIPVLSVPMSGHTRKFLVPFESEENSLPDMKFWSKTIWADIVFLYFRVSTT